MRRMRPEPEPVEQIAAAVHAWEEAKRSVEELQTALAEAELRAAEAKALVGRIAAVMASQEPAPEPPMVIDRIAAIAAKKSPFFVPSPKRSPYRAVIEDLRVAICWRLAFILLEDPVLDYQKTAELFWGSGLDKSVAKNRVNAQMTRLRKLDVVKTLGSNRYEVDRARLAEKSRLQVPEEAS